MKWSKRIGIVIIIVAIALLPGCQAAIVEQYMVDAAITRTTTDNNNISNDESMPEQTHKDEANMSDKPSVKPTTVEEAQVETTIINESMSWQEFVKDMGMGWNLGNTFDASDCTWVSNDLEYEGAWLPDHSKTTKEMILLVKEQGFRTIRIPISWHNHVDLSTDEQGNKIYIIRKEWMDRIKEVVDYCYEEDLYVILNIHHDNSREFIYPTQDCKEQSLNYLTQIWTQIATVFAEYDLHVIYEVMNEVRLVGTGDEWNPNSLNSQKAQGIVNEYAQEAVNSIRAVDRGYNRERFILCSGYAAALDSYPSHILPTDLGGVSNRIIVSVHAYTPYSFCMDTSQGQHVYDAQVQAAVQDVFRVIDKQWTSKDIPVVIGEWGAIMREDNATQRQQYAQEYVKMATTACQDSSGNTVQIPCILWDNANVETHKGETFGVLDRKNMMWVDKAYVDMIIGTWKQEQP